MYKVILVSHGPLAQALLESAEFLCGAQQDVETLGLYLGDSVDEFGERVRASIEEGLAAGEVLVLSDIQSGSPFNVTCQAMGELDFSHVTGMNLPCVIQALWDREGKSAQEAAAECVAVSASTIFDVGELLRGSLAEDDDEDDED